MKLIDKDSVLSEIDSRIEKYMRLKWKPKISDIPEMQCNSPEKMQCKIDCLRSLKEWINNSHEVKEVDLEKDLEDFLEKNSDSNGFFNPLDVAKHFYELGLKAQNKITISQQRLSVLKMEFWTGLETFNASEMTLSDAYNKGIEDILEELDIEKV